MKKGALIALAAGFFVLFFGGGSRYAIGLTLKPMVEEFSWDRGHIGSAVALFQIVTAFAMYAAGILADRMSLRLLLGGGIATSGLLIGLVSTVSEPWHLMVLFGVLFGVANGAISITPVAVMITRAFPGRTGLANAVVTSGMSVGQLILMASLAAVLVSVGWRSVFVWLGVAHLLLLPLLFAVPSAAANAASTQQQPREGLSVREAARTGRFWLLMAVYAICGFGDFFVTTHVVAFAQDRGITPLLAGNLLALMGLTGLIGVVAAGALSDRAGPVWPAVACFLARAAVFALVLVDQSQVSVAIFALVFGLTFLVTAPLTVIFVRDAFGTRHLGAISGLISMVHHICGGIGAYWGAAVFDDTGRYDTLFMAQLVLGVLALVLTFGLRRPKLAA